MRIDSWLWTTRFFKSRSQATAACRAGRIRLNDSLAKASAMVKPGDVITWRDPLRPRIVTVVELLPRRVSAPLAAAAFEDASPPVPTREERGSVPMRDRGAGRPEKRDRRKLDDLRGFNK